MTTPRLISFVIPAWNEESVLGPTLEYIRDRGAMGVWYGDRRPDPELSER